MMTLRVMVNSSAAALIATGFFGIPTLASDYPVSTSAHDDSGTQMMEFSCSKLDRVTVSCAFTQIVISRGPEHHDPVRRQSAVDATVEQFKKESDQKTCSTFGAVASALEAGRIPDYEIPGLSDRGKFEQSISDWLKGPSREREDTRILMSLAFKACEKPDRQSALALVDHMFDRKRRSCSIWTNKFSHEFKADGDGRWVSNLGPSGQCGVVHVSVLERDPDYRNFWNYETRKIVTNKQGTSDFLLKCEDLDEEVQKFTWKGDTTYLGCDYVKFGYP
ncbi:MAG: hypothetical protein RLN96_04830 [Pseudomonadales bacterium]